MKELRCTLLTDGSTDRALLPVLLWLLRQHLPETALQAEWADLRRLAKVPRGLAARIQQALEWYPCDLLFVHRDAEKEPREKRLEEIRAAAAECAVPVVCVVPVRMQEAWMLFDESAIRAAAANPNGECPLDLPHPAKVEQVPDPKVLLYELLRTASELTGRRRKKFEATASAYRVAEFISDFSPLRRLGAFRALEAEVDEVLTSQKWK